MRKLDYEPGRIFVASVPLGNGEQRSDRYEALERCVNTADETDEQFLARGVVEGKLRKLD